MRNWTPLLLAFLLVITPVMTASAQTEPTISYLEIALWPEYDQPSMLVIYYITLAPTTTLPTSLDLRIPAEVGTPHAVAVIPPDGVPVDLEHELSSDGEWITISLVANLGELQIEYYDPRLNVDGKNRSFTYLWPGDYAVQSSVVKVLEPFDASEVTVSPGPINQQVSGEQTYLIKDVGSLSKNQSFELEIAYSKESDVLGITQLPVRPVEPLTSEPDWQGRMQDALPWVLGLGGVLLIAGGVIWYVRSGQQTQPAVRKRRRSRPAPTRVESAGAPEGIYCHQCGKRAAAGDRFCRSCGTRLRVE